MRARTTTAVLACLLAVPSSASSAEPVTTDPCGDVLLRASGGGQTVSVPDPRDRPLDIQGLSFVSVFGSGEDGEAVFEGVDVNLHLCTPAGYPAIGEAFEVSWGVEAPPGQEGAECTESVSLFRGLVLGVDTYLAARYDHWCVLPDSLPGHYSAAFSQDLSYRGMLKGNTLTWELRVDRLEPGMSGSVAAGQVWSSPWGQTRGTQVPGRTSTVEAGVASATAGTFADEAGPGSDVTLGSG
jgi:hypothetical protein